MGYKFFFLFIGLEPTTWPANNGLLLCNVFQLCLAANNILVMCKWNHCFLLLVIVLVWKWQIVLFPTDKSWYFAQPGPVIVNIKSGIVHLWWLKLKKGVFVCLLTLISPLSLLKVAVKNFWISGSRFNNVVPNRLLLRPKWWFLIINSLLCFLRFCDVRFVDGEKLLASGLPVTPTEFESLVKQQCATTREFLKRT